MVLWANFAMEAWRGHRRDHEDRGDPGSGEGANLPAFNGPGTLYVTGPGGTISAAAFGAHTSFSTSRGPSIVTGASQRAGSGLTVVEYDEPIRAWKYAAVVGGGPDDNGKLLFEAQSVAEVYGVEETARCSYQRDHRAPDESCSCGFYARMQRMDVYGPYSVLEVELYGKVLLGTNGYRAEKQRVLSVTAPRPLCLRAAEEGERCSHQSRARYVNTVGELLCAVHAMEQRRKFAEWAPEPVNCETEWRWAD
jgi:hypothetical protein